jgi:hypothetical protein
LTCPDPPRGYLKAIGRVVENDIMRLEFFGLLVVAVGCSGSPDLRVAEASGTRPALSAADGAAGAERLRKLLENVDDALADRVDPWSDVDRWTSRRIDLDGDGVYETVVSREFHGAYGQHQELFVISEPSHGPRTVAKLAACDGSIRWVLLDGRPAALVSEIYDERAAGRAVAWDGVTAVRHRLFAFEAGAFVLRECFFTAFDGRYP